MGNHLSNSPETILPPPSSIMALLFNFKTFVFGLFVYYATYLHYYKCPSLTPIVELEEKILHPLTNQHSTLCELVNGGIDRATPYVNKVHGFLDKNVHSHPLLLSTRLKNIFNVQRTDGLLMFTQWFTNCTNLLMLLRLVFTMKLLLSTNKLKKLFMVS